MSTVVNGEILRLSVSQIEKFIGCPRQWYFEAVRGRYPEDSAPSEDGVAGHKLVAHYLKTGELPKGRVKMGKMVTGAIAAGLFPLPGSDLLVERRFSGQEQYDAAGKWIVLDRSKAALWAAGIPLDGAADLMFRRDGLVSVVDQKFTSDIHAEWTLKAEDLPNTVQMPGYGVVALSLWPDAELVELRHNYISRKGADSEPRSIVVPAARIRERWAEVDQVVEKEMKLVAKATKQDEVPAAKSIKVCEKYMGCPHQSRCHAFKEKSMGISKEDLELFGEAPSQPKAKAPVVDPFADLDEAPASPKAELAALVSAVAAEVAAVIPPDAPANDASTPPPAKAKKGKKAPPIVDVAEGESEEQATARAAQMAGRICRWKQGAYYEVEGTLCTFTCLTNGDQGSFQPVAGGAPLLVAPGPASLAVKESAAPVIPEHSKATPSVLTVELGPKSLAVLTSLLERLTH